MDDPASQLETHSEAFAAESSAGLAGLVEVAGWAVCYWIGGFALEDAGSQLRGPSGEASTVDQDAWPDLVFYPGKEVALETG